MPGNRAPGCASIACAKRPNRAGASHPSDNPKLLAEAGAQLRATAAEAACQDAISAELVALGFQIDRFEALPGRDDVVGRLAGAGGGRH